MTPVEQLFADAMTVRGISFEAQHGLLWRGDECKSRYRCKCGVDRFNEDTEDWEEGRAVDMPENCRWYRRGTHKYVLDFFVNVGPGIAIEIDDYGTHSSAKDRADDLAREKEIEARLGYEFIRFTASDVCRNASACVDTLQAFISEYREKPKQAPVDYSKSVPVCSACSRASCWQRVFPCQWSSDGTREILSIATLRELGREHPSFWTEAWIDLGNERRARTAGLS